MVLATDGSEEAGKGSFGWILATPTGNLLAQRSGPVFGHQTVSFRGEAYAILASLRFLIQL